MLVINFIYICVMSFRVEILDINFIYVCPLGVLIDCKYAHEIECFCSGK